MIKRPNWSSIEEIEQIANGLNDADLAAEFINSQKKRLTKRPYYSGSRSGPYTYSVENIHISRCYNCNEIGVWFGERIAWPQRGSISRPNQDMPQDARLDYEEAAEIVDNSPRGAAALLRLAIQKICLHLGGEGKHINEDIASLVKKGLDPRVQKALDVVRVVGNNAVHPGEMDIRDDRETADSLFNLVNMIVDIMISQPKHVSNLFSKLPEGARDAISKRDS